MGKRIAAAARALEHLGMAQMVLAGLLLAWNLGACDEHQEPLERMAPLPAVSMEPESLTDSLDDAPLFSRALDDVRKHEFPADAETRALLYLKPHPQGYIGHLPDNFDFEKFEYAHHRCHKLPPSSLVCTACYSHPRQWLGQLSVECPLEAGAECSLLLLNAQQLERHFGVDFAWCESGEPAP